MTLFAYYAAFDESIVILRDICERGFRVVVDEGPYPEPKVTEFNTVTDEVIERLREAPGFYLLGAFTRHPIAFEHLDSGEAAGQYSIDDSIQGPLLQGQLARVNVVDGAPRLLRGFASYHDESDHPKTRRAERASDAVRKAYRDTVSVIKKHVQAYEAGVTINISPSARQMLESGAAGIDNERVVVSREPQ